MSKETISTVEELVEEKGILFVANMLGHDDTNRIKRWIRDGEIPKNQERGVHAIINLERDNQ